MTVNVEEIPAYVIQAIILIQVENSVYQFVIHHAEVEIVQHQIHALAIAVMRKTIMGLVYQFALKGAKMENVLLQMNALVVPVID